MLSPRTINSRYRWNPALGTTGRYIAPSGRMVPQKTVTGEMEWVIGGVKGEMQSLSRDLQSGNISLQEWYDGMRDRVKIIHTLDAAIAKGGWAQMSQSDWGAVGAITKFQYGKLNDFALQIADGLALDGRFLVRAGMYADAARGTGEDMKRREADRNPTLTEEMRELGAADHCTTRNGVLGCIELNDMGWQPIGTLPRIGDTPCGTNCHCNFVFR